MGKQIDTEVVKQKKITADNLRNLLVEGLKCLYWSEKALVINLPTMAENATSPKLKKALEDHLAKTAKQISRLETAFEIMGEKTEAVKCDPIASLLEQVKSIIKDAESGAIKDERIIAAARKIEHFEIATYGTMATYALVLEEKEIFNLLGTSLDEEKTCDEDLTKLVASEITIKT